MKLSLLATACVALAQASFVAATYFTSPQSGDTISNAGGLKVTWKYQPGGAPKGTFILETVQASARQNTQVVIASEVDLVNTASVTIPNDLNARKSSTNTYRLLIVNSADLSTIYTQAAPLTIKSFGSSSSGDASSTTSRARTAAKTTQAVATTTRKSIALSTTTAAAVETSPPAAASTPSTTSTTTTTTAATTSTTDAVVVVTSYAPIVTVLESSSSAPAANVVTVVLTTMAPQSSSSSTSTGPTTVVGASAQSQASSAMASKAFVGGASFVAIFVATITMLC
ncbi:BZ3500_MvSof-1268-A1-R1_Chr4-2g07194 [Microbotryum saponariae]|uniref:BZ3500_MvSof-1268-A1-R1_Chr4-2g07194 protein n=1 Tax=Microbotryum saponariae TaxID=289078 RepID=A0A2X0KY59_9BASI|nr:BZ3500_MvSof-1268-A1-R1_Chr4-2g07194 [Microbotryum saponariae]SDA06859.1 BZ3501_MvSof-1269-A2-R1_Chr4-2g06905 [Microbotryum saponariae]